MTEPDRLEDLEKHVSLMAAHLVPFLKAQEQVHGLQEQVRALESARANRTERPLIHGIAKALAQLRHLRLDPVSQEVVEGELVRALTAAGCGEFGQVGDDFDPDRHVVVVSDGTGSVVTRVHARGIETYGDVLVKAQVDLGVLPQDPAREAGDPETTGESEGV